MRTATCMRRFAPQSSDRCLSSYAIGLTPRVPPSTVRCDDWRPLSGYPLMSGSIARTSPESFGEQHAHDHLHARTTHRSVIPFTSGFKVYSGRFAWFYVTYSPAASSTTLLGTVYAFYGEHRKTAKTPLAFPTIPQANRNPQPAEHRCRSSPIEA